MHRLGWCCVASKGYNMSNTAACLLAAAALAQSILAGWEGVWNAMASPCLFLLNHAPVPARAKCMFANYLCAIVC